jgi:hypothetical protein
MLTAQNATYGDGLDLRYLHPYMWAWKPHYFDNVTFGQTRLNGELVA